MSRQRRSAVLAGVVAGLVSIAVLRSQHVHSALGGLVAAAVTGAVIAIVNRVLEGRGAAKK